jgi:transcription elongation factor Elf1
MTARKTTRHYGKLGGQHEDKRRKTTRHEYDEELELYANDCPHCGASNLEDLEAESLMGSMGSIEHHRCRYCGMNFERIAE